MLYPHDGHARRQRADSASHAGKIASLLHGCRKLVGIASWSKFEGEKVLRANFLEEWLW